MWRNRGTRSRPRMSRLGMGLAGLHSRLSFYHSMERPLKMNILLTTLLLQPLMLVTLYLYVSGVFSNRRAFQITFCCVAWACFALSIAITIRLSPGSDLLASTAFLLSGVLPQS